MSPYWLINKVMAVEQRIEERKMIGENIRRARKAKSLSQRKVAARCGIDASDIGKIERAEIDPQITTILELAAAIGVPSSELFKGVDVNQ